MRKSLSRPRIIFPEGFDERTAFETPLKGWLNAQVELEDGRRYAVYFSDPVRLQQDLEEAVNDGRPCFAEPGLIIVPEVTVEIIQNAVLFLWTAPVGGDAAAGRGHRFPPQAGPGPPGQRGQRPRWAPGAVARGPGRSRAPGPGCSPPGTGSCPCLRPPSRRPSQWSCARAA